MDEVCQQPGGMNIQISISSIGVLMLQLDASIWQESRAHYWKQYLRALGRLYWELGRVVLHRCCSWAWSVLVLELRSLSPTLLRAALLGEQASTARSSSWWTTAIISTADSFLRLEHFRVSLSSHITYRIRSRPGHAPLAVPISYL